VQVTTTWLAEQREEDPEALGERLVQTYDAVLPRPAGRPRA
jgi:hypothetical protein